MKIDKKVKILYLLFLMMVWLTSCKAQTAKSTTISVEGDITPTFESTPVPSQPIGNLEYLQTFEKVWRTVDQTYFDPNFGGLDWQAVHEAYEPRIAITENDEDFYLILNQMLWELNVSHTGVGPVDEWPSVEPVVWKDGEIGIDVRLLHDQATITRVEAGSPAEKAGLKPGFTIQNIESAPVAQILEEKATQLAPPNNEQSRIDQLTRSLLSRIYGEPGTCVTLTYHGEKDELREKCIERVQRTRTGFMGDVLPPAYLEFESQRLQNNIGYIRFNTFHPDLIPDLVAAVAEMQDAPGIILDLRGNPGGDPTTADALAAQFLDGHVLFGNFKARSGTFARLVTGENIYTGPLVVLIDALSYSGSEYFASGMQELGRAVIVGERSPGGATAMDVITLPNDAILGFPVAQLLTKDGDVLEGVGVIPDLSTSLERHQLLNGIDTQLKSAIDTILSDMP